MRKKMLLLSFVLMVIAVTTLSSCRHHHNTSISVKENGDVFQLSASFSPSKTRKLQHYMDSRLDSDVSFENTEMDAVVTLDDETKFYMKSYPGFVKIRFNKNENSVESYEKMRGLCEGIKEVVH